MRVCMLTGSFLPRTGGMEYAIHYLAESLCNMGIDVVVFCHRSYGQISFRPSYEIVRYGINLPFSGRIGLNRYLCLRALVNYHKKKTIDIIHCHNVSYPGEIAVTAKKLLKVPIIMTPHGEDVQKFPQINYGKRLNPKWEKKIRFHLEVADAVSAISKSIAEDISFVDPNKLYYIPNGVEISKFLGQPTKFLHKFLGLEDDTKIILSVGRNHPKKGYIKGIEAFAKSSLYHDAKCVYVIIGKDVPLLKKFVDQLGLSDYVFLVPEIPHDKMPECYRSACLFFSPSITEGLSLVSLEAMVSGLPILATDVPGNRDIVQENDCGILVPVNNIRKMAEGLRMLILNEKLRESYVAKAIRNRNKFDWKVIAQQYFEVYKTLLLCKKG